MLDGELTWDQIDSDCGNKNTDTHTNIYIMTVTQAFR